MKIDNQTFQTLEKLAKLNVADNERDVTIKKIAGVLDMLDKIDMNEIADLIPLYHPLEISQPLRKDVPNPRIHREGLQAGSPLVEKGLFLVPKVLD